MTGPAVNNPDAPQLRQLQLSLPIALLKAREVTMDRFRPMLRQHELTEQQWRVIRVLQSSGALEVGELARRSLLLAPSLSRILRSLENEGLVLRESVEGDGRRFVMSLTSAGLDLFATIAPQSESIYRDIEAHFGRDRLQRLLGMLGELETALQDEDLSRSA